METLDCNWRTQNARENYEKYFKEIRRLSIVIGGHNARENYEKYFKEIWRLSIVIG